MVQHARLVKSVIPPKNWDARDLLAQPFRLRRVAKRMTLRMMLCLEHVPLATTRRERLGQVDSRKDTMKRE